VALQALTDLVGLPEFDAALGLGGEGVSSWLGVCEGEDLEILIRSRDGWTCCRRRPAAGAEGEDETVGWLPEHCVAELAFLGSDHAADCDDALSLDRGAAVELLSRHYSGWFHCREWLGIERRKEPRRSGWVCSSYLNRPPAEARALVLDALAALLGQATALETAAAAAAAQGADSAEECLSKFFRVASELAEELESLSRAVAESERSGAVVLRAGAVAVAARDVAGGEPEQLGFQQGARLLVLHVDASGWVWCRDTESGCEGWAPRDSLSVAGALAAEQELEEEEEADLDSITTGLSKLSLPLPATPRRLTTPTPRPTPRPTTAETSPPTATSGFCLSRPNCAICLERLGMKSDGVALPCAHTFHAECLGQWLQEKRECPLCRAPAADEDDANDIARHQTEDEVRRLRSRSTWRTLDTARMAVGRVSSQSPTGWQIWRNLFSG